MQAVCLITLMFVNGIYVFISFNMEAMLPENEPEQIEEVVVSSATNTEFDPADILDLDILDFAMDEMDGKEAGSRSRSPHLVHERV